MKNVALSSSGLPKQTAFEQNPDKLLELGSGSLAPRTPHLQLIGERCPSSFSLLWPLTDHDGFKISLKILKVILCGDFLRFYIIHHFPE
jgi:hypothetical protein